jgi:ribosomal protein L14E/L6E/L27E
MPKDKDIGIGSIVKATMGRDKDKFFVVTGFIDDNYVLMADGCSRRISRPKKKKLKHITVMKDVALEVRDKILEGKCVLDAEIRKSLKSMGYESK